MMMMMIYIYIYIVHLFTQSSSDLRCTCPNQRNLFLLTTSTIDSTPKRLLSSMFVCLSRNDTPHIRLIILISVLSNFASCSTFIGHVSLPYNIQLLIQHLYILFFTASDAPLWA